MVARKLVVGALCGGVVLATMASHVREADADPPKVGPVAPAPAVTPAKPFKRTPFRTAAKPALTLSEADKPKVRSALDRAFAQFAKDKDTTKLMNAGVSLAPESEAIYRNGAAAFLSKSKSRGIGLNPARPAATVVGTYSIEAGEVVAASTIPPCDGEIQVTFTVKNRGVQLPAGTTARLFANLVRMDGPSRVISSAWVNLPPIANGATATVQLPTLRHRSPNPSSGYCPHEEIIVSPSFVDVAPREDYRLKIQLTDAGADATLLAGQFLSLEAGSGAPGSGGCFLSFRCPAGNCAFICPPCSAGMVEIDGGCWMDN